MTKVDLVYKAVVVSLLVSIAAILAQIRNSIPAAAPTQRQYELATSELERARLLGQSPLVSVKGNVVIDGPVQTFGK